MRRELQLLLLSLLFALLVVALLILLLPAGLREPSPPSAAPLPSSAAPLPPSAAPVPPPEEVAATLLERADLIPFEGTLGGTMGFYTEEDIHVLNDRWVFARFEDGHVAGEMLLEYRTNESGELEWRVLAAELE